MEHAHDPVSSAAPSPEGWRSWLLLRPADAERMADKLFLSRGDSGRNRSAFWVLLLLAAVIASAGVVGDSTATVIGAMIVAPLMTPILGTALAIVTANRRHLRSSALLVIAGAASVVLVGFLLGLLIPVEVVASTNSQVASRVSPTLIDLVAAIATGLVGAFALVRSDVSDTLPGVAIAISLVPPLAVVGLTLESGAVSQSLGALLLFGTNVAAIIATGTVLLLLAEVRGAVLEAGVELGELGTRTVATVMLGVTLVAVPLGIGSWHVLQEQLLIARAQPVADEWAESQGWQLTQMTVRQSVLQVVALGRPPEADEAELRDLLDEAGLEDVTVSVTLVVGASRILEQ